MFSLVLLLLASTALIDAKPSRHVKPSFSKMIVGGENASPGEFPWQLSQHQLETTWMHWCGASLLGALRALSAAHCVDGTPAANVRMIAGLHNQDDMTGTQTSNAARFVLHEQYDVGLGSFPNDIAIIHLETSIVTGAGVQYAVLPADNSDDFAGETCIISGWGRTSATFEYPNTLQKASISVITGDECQTIMGTTASIVDTHICVYDQAEQIGSCNADSGGPLSCGPQGSMVVAGITSFGISTLVTQTCLQEYPSVYTRTSAYLDWIGAN